MTSYFSENQEAVIGCSESPQASLREKASKVNYLSLLKVVLEVFCFSLDGKDHFRVNSLILFNPVET